ncbi:MAG: MCE family protein [Xanthomonadales bacterium]|nr:MCE family protein [Xanthomonadales bacterium]
METRAHHILIGTFAIVAFLLGVGFVLWLSKTSADREFGYYDVVFTEAVTGLSKGGLVQYNGIKVGEVTQLKLAPDDPRKVVARVRLDGDTPVKMDTRPSLACSASPAPPSSSSAADRRHPSHCCRPTHIQCRSSLPRNRRCRN